MDIYEYMGKSPVIDDLIGEYTRIDIALDRLGEIDDEATRQELRSIYNWKLEQITERIERLANEA